MKTLFALLTLLLWTAALRADPADAVVCVPSHGGSATVIATGDGWTILLSAAHLFWDQGGKPSGQKRGEKITLKVPVNVQPGQHIGTAGVRCAGTDEAADLSLIVMNFGPLPFVCPVAPRGHKLSRTLASVGFDAMKLPPQNRPAEPVKVEGATTYTRQKPWHGRSGGGLLDGPYLVGVCSGYTGQKPRQFIEYDGRSYGVYVSHAAVLAFLDRLKVAEWCVAAGDRPQVYLETSPVAPIYQPPQVYEYRAPGNPWNQQFCPPGKR